MLSADPLRDESSHTSERLECVTICLLYSKITKVVILSQRKRSHNCSLWYATIHTTTGLLGETLKHGFSLRKGLWINFSFDREASTGPTQPAEHAKTLKQTLCFNSAVLSVQLRVKQGPGWPAWEPETLLKVAFRFLNEHPEATWRGGNFGHFTVTSLKPFDLTAVVPCISDPTMRKKQNDKMISAWKQNQ